jgi:hypothetical protein
MFNYVSPEQRIQRDSPDSARDFLQRAIDEASPHAPEAVQSYCGKHEEGQHPHGVAVNPDLNPGSHLSNRPMYTSLQWRHAESV